MMVQKKNPSGAFIGHTSCDKCGSSDALAVYQDEYTKQYNGYCFSTGCGEYASFGNEQPVVASIKKPSSSNGAKMEIQRITALPSTELKERRINESVAKKYGVKQIETPDGKVTRYYPVKKNGEITGYKIRELPKRFYSMGDCKGAKELFGQSCFQRGGKLLIITEGEEDALAAYMMTALKRKSRKGFPCVSITDGIGSQALRSIEQNLEFINSFEQVVFAVDQESDALEMAKEFCSKLDPGKGRIASFSENDASDMWLRGKQDEFWTAIWDAITPEANRAVDNFSSAWEAWQDRLNYEVVPWPSSWGMDAAGSGLYAPAVMTLTAGTGIGKSTVLKHLQYHLFTETDATIGVISLEEPLSLCEGVLMGMHLKKRITVPGVHSSEEEQQRACQELFGSGRFIFYDNLAIKDFDDFFNKIRYMASARSCKYIFVDHLTALLNKVSPDSNKNAHTELLINKLNELSLELKICLILVSHTRGLPATATKTYEEGLVPSEDSIFGSSSIKQYSSCNIAISRDKTKEQSPMYIHVLKDRLSGQTGRSKALIYDTNTGRLV